jgi:tetratricopeptide (TPR) repeat protein
MIKDMKKIYLSAIALLVLGATSCNNFLDEMPDNRTELDNEDKIAKALVSAYPDATFSSFLRFMTDDYDMIHPTFNVAADVSTTDVWHWRDEMEENNDSPKNVWQNHYYGIAHANQALQGIEALGNPESLDPQRGEALVARAWNHFVLVNLFCQHYHSTFSETDMGIPYMETPETEVNPMYERGTVKHVYEMIARDLEAGIPLIDDTVYEVPKYHFNRLAALGFAAEFYLYYGDYDKCIAYADQVLGNDPEKMLRDLTTYMSLGTTTAFWNDYIRSDYNVNLLLHTAVTTGAGLNGGLVGGYNPRFSYTRYTWQIEGPRAPSILWSTVTPITNQVVMMPWFGGAVSPGGPEGFGRFTVPYFFEMLDPVAQTGYRRTVRVAVSADNVALCRAEAQIMKGNFGAAMEDINRWVKMRIHPPYNAPKTAAQVIEYYGGLPYYEPLNPTVKKRFNVEHTLTSDQENMMHALLHLRRIEFWDEGLRWFDIKRWGIEITRRTIRGNDALTPEGIANGIELYTGTEPLKYRDLRQAIQLPTGVIAAGMTPNPR